jgi:hypothetical protein
MKYLSWVLYPLVGDGRCCPPLHRYTHFDPSSFELNYTL